MREARLKKLRHAFAPQHPCPPEFFVGREEYLKYYDAEVLIPKYEKITPAPVNAAFLGEWGIGKTSILNYLASGKFVEDGCVSLPIIRDFRTVDDLFTRSLQNIAVSVSKIEWLKEKISGKLENMGISPFTFKIKVERPLLSDLLVQTWGLLENSGVKHCAILIDDFHRLGYEDMFSLRSVFQHLPGEGCNYSLVATGATWTFVREPAEPVARFFDKKLLPPFTGREVEQALRKPIDLLKFDLDFDAGYIDELTRITLGYPYFVKFITLELAKNHAMLNEKLIAKQRKNLLNVLGKAKFEDDFKRASAGEQKVLVEIAKKRLLEFEAKELKTIKGYAAYLDRLCEKELLNWKERGVYSIYHPLFLEWLIAFAPFKAGGLV